MAILFEKHLLKIKNIAVLYKCVSNVKLLKLFFYIMNLCHFLIQNPN